MYAIRVEGVIKNLARLHDPDLLQALHEVLAGIREFIANHQLVASMTLYLSTIYLSSMNHFFICQGVY